MFDIKYFLSLSHKLNIIPTHLNSLVAAGFCDHTETCNTKSVYVNCIHMVPVKGKCSRVLGSRHCLTQQLQHFYWSLSYQLRDKHIW